MRAACVLLLLATGCVIEDRTFEPSGRDADTEDPPWTGIASGTDVTLNAIWGTGPSQVWAVGDGGTILEYNGQDWIPVDPPPTTMSLRAVGGTQGGGQVYAVGDNGTILQRTSGVWNQVTSNTGVDLFAVLAVASDDVYAAGQNGTILHADASGMWTLMDSMSIEDLHALWKHSTGTTIYGVGDGDTTLRKPAADWDEFGVGTGIAHRGGWASNFDTGYYVGTGGSLRSYINDTPWDYTAWNVDTTSDLLAIWGNESNPNEVFAVGEGGVARRYNGVDWENVDLATSGALRGIWGWRISEPSLTLVVGDGGDIWSYTPPP